jgi:DNA-binding CsgD family transcriptional regulator
VLGYKPEDFTVSFFLSLIHPEDLKNMKSKEALILDFLTTQIEPHEMPFYKKCYVMRFKKNDGNYATILHQTIVQSVSLNNRVLQVLGIHTDISHLNVLQNNSVSIIGLEGRKSYMNLNPLINSFEYINEKERFSKRGLEVLLHISKGLSVKNIAEKLLVSTNTVKHHKKKLAIKSNTNNVAELIVYAVRNGLIN